MRLAKPVIQSHKNTFKVWRVRSLKTWLNQYENRQYQPTEVSILERVGVLV